MVVDLLPLHFLSVLVHRLKVIDIHLYSSWTDNHDGIEHQVYTRVSRITLLETKDWFTFHRLPLVVPSSVTWIIYRTSESLFVIV
jgi:hypothetical protein